LEPTGCSSRLDPEETSLMADPRFGEAVGLFNAGEWYACHDGFEELWHESQGSCRKALQGILQIAVAHLHLERGNLRGATVLLGEGLGRLQAYGSEQFGLDLDGLRSAARARLVALQSDADPQVLPLPVLRPAPAEPSCPS
jgi:predicted metal-dependent hydrolase